MLNRRSFLMASGLTALASTRVLGASDTIRVGVIGAGGRMRGLLDAAEKAGPYQIVAVSDVYGTRRDAVKQRSNGTATTLTIPGAADAGTVQPLGTYGDQLPLLIGGGCDGHVTFSVVDWYNPGTNAARTVLGGRAGGGYVTGAVLFPAS